MVHTELKSYNEDVPVYGALPMNTCSGPFEKKPFMKLEGEWLNVIYSKTPGGVSHCTLALVHFCVISVSAGGHCSTSWSSL